jgi:hypothetical protein
MCAHRRRPNWFKQADRVAGRDCWLTMLTDAQVAAQAFDFRAETRLGVAAEAFALVGAFEPQDGRAGNAFAEALAMNMLEGEVNLLRTIGPACKCAEAERGRRNSDAAGFPAAQCYSANREG